MVRAEAQQTIADIGGIIGNSVTAYSDQIDPLSALQIDPPELSDFFG
jgi:hypothetical protein